VPPPSATIVFCMPPPGETGKSTADPYTRLLLMFGMLPAANQTVGLFTASTVTHPLGNPAVPTAGKVRKIPRGYSPSWLFGNKVALGPGNVLPVVPGCHSPPDPTAGLGRQIW